MEDIQTRQQPAPSVGGNEQRRPGNFGEPMLRAAYIAMRNMVWGGSLASAGLIGNPRRMVGYVTESLFLYRLMAQRDDLLQVPVWNVLGRPGEVEDVNIQIYTEAATEWFRDVPSYAVDLVSLCMLCRILKPKLIFEIGTLRGSGTLHLAGNSPSAEVYSLDLGTSDRPSLATTMVDGSHVQDHSQVRKYFFSGRPEEARIHCLFGDSAEFDFSHWGRQVDLFFIDGAHSYDYVRNDTLKALKCVHPDSVVAWHDYGRMGVNGVSRWLHEFRGQDRKIFRVPGGSLAYMRL
jgi:predicted O-methyltransferase YrrM